MADAETLERNLDGFKNWFNSIGGFGEYLTYFFQYYGPFFREYQETQMFVYTKLHKEFTKNVETAVNFWLQSQGLTESDLEQFLEFAQQKGDAEADNIVNMLIHMLDYHLWIKYIFELKKTTEIKEDYDEADERWKVIGGTGVDWSVDWWEAWTDKEWEEWWAENGEDSKWEDDFWEKKQDEWAETDWNVNAHGEQTGAGAEPSLVAVCVPEGVGAGMELQVQTPDGQLLTTVVPEGVAPGDTFNVQYVPL